MRPVVEVPTLKIERAQEHFNDLDRILRNYNASNPYHVIFEPDPEGSGKYRGRIAIDVIPEPKWPAIMGDFVHNLRSVLDHFAWSFAWRRSSNPPPVQFPIFRRVPSTRNEINLWKKHTGCLGDAYDFVESLQPYHRGQEATAHPLWLLHETDIADKHRTIATLGHHIRIPLDQFGIAGASFVGIVNDGDIIARFGAKPEQDDMPRLEGRVMFDVSPDIPFGMPFAALYGINQFVRNEVIPPLVGLLSQPASV